MKNCFKTVSHFGHPVPTHTCVCNAAYARCAINYVSKFLLLEQGWNVPINNSICLSKLGTKHDGRYPNLKRKRIYNFSNFREWPSRTHIRLALSKGGNCQKKRKENEEKRMEKNHANSWHSKALAVDQHVQVCFYWREKCNMAPQVYVCVLGAKQRNFCSTALLPCAAYAFQHFFREPWKSFIWGTENVMRCSLRRGKKKRVKLCIHDLWFGTNVAFLKQRVSDIRNARSCMFLIDCVGLCPCS